MTHINIKLHDQWIAERDASRSPCFPDFPAWLEQQRQQIEDQQAEIKGKETDPRQPVGAFASLFSKKGAKK